MKIGIILHPYGEQKSAGLAEYIFELTKNLIANDQTNEYLIFLKPLDKARGRIKLPEFHSDNWRVVSLGFGRWWRELGLFFAPRADLYIFNTPMMPLFFKPKKSIVIALDFAYLYFQPAPLRQGFGWASNKILFWLNGFSMRRADLVIAISEATKKDVVKFFGIDEKKIKVIYPGFRDLNKIYCSNEIENNNQDVFSTSPLICRASSKNVYCSSHAYRQAGEIENKSLEPTCNGLVEPYFLFVGVIKERKNVFNIVSAFIELKKKYNLPHKLIIAGKGGGSYLDKINELIKKEVLENEIIFTGYVSDERLVGLYKGAEALVFPSLVEGFGFPVLEAMGVGVPVITSKTSSLSEVAGEAALLVDPYSISEIAEAMHKIASDGNLRRDLISRGLERIKYFSWQQTAEKFLKEIKFTF